uniref:Ig-like domain-containing protein n=1 Tax=Ditylenchus dipsaci TaxID=166011 RepID=A0A915EMM5_9BILA
MWKCPLSSFELFFCFVVSTCYYATAFLSGCYTTYKFSSAPTNSIDYKWASGWIVDSPYISGWQTDTSDGEWKLFRNSVSKTTLVLLLHSEKGSYICTSPFKFSTSAPTCSQTGSDYLEYLLYPPYSGKHHQAKNPQHYNKVSIAMVYGYSPGFWFFFIEATLHLSRANAFFNSPYQVLQGFSYYQSMSPPAPPICPARVSRFSLLWRYFDQGLHKFLKHQSPY